MIKVLLTSCVFPQQLSLIQTDSSGITTPSIDDDKQMFPTLPSASVAEAARDHHHHHHHQQQQGRTYAVWAWDVAGCAEINQLYAVVDYQILGLAE